MRDDKEYMEKLEHLLFGLIIIVEDLLHDINLDEWDYQFHRRKMDELRELAVDLQ